MSSVVDPKGVVVLAQKHQNALLKFISPNDAGATGAHQSGFYMPFGARDFYTSLQPTEGENGKEKINILWNDEVEIDSVITWYGKETRHEYRLTKFGRGFRFLNTDSVGNLLVLIKIGDGKFLAYVFEEEESIDLVLAELGVNPLNGWARYPESIPDVLTEDDCIESKINDTVSFLSEFPESNFFSDKTHQFVEDCIEKGDIESPDDALLNYYKIEERFFKALEKKIFEPRLQGGFSSTDEFTEAALSLLNRRKSRSGRSLENHVDYVLNKAGIVHDIRPRDIEGAPDVVIPSADYYHKFDDAIVLAIKTTCKDRWRQILNEAKKARKKYLLTLQPYISESQLKEMGAADVTLVVPTLLKKGYQNSSDVEILDISSFCALVKSKIFHK